MVGVAHLKGELYGNRHFCKQQCECCLGRMVDASVSSHIMLISAPPPLIFVRNLTAIVPNDLGFKMLSYDLSMFCSLCVSLCQRNITLI